jgi:hypothetical protein
MTWPTGADPLAWAEAYLARQWTPLPIWPLVAQADRLVCTCWAAEGCASPGKHPRVPWRHLDHVGAGQAREWWGRSPDSGVALRTGGACHLVVVDVDPAHGGRETAARLADRYGPWPATLTVATGGGGWHWYFQSAEGGLRNAAGGALGAGVDLRADGGIVVAPPSPHASGRRYHVEDPAATVAPLPAWLPELLRRPAPASVSLPAVVRAIPAGAGESPYGLAALEAEARQVAATAPGGRNHRLVKAAFRAGQLAAGGELDPGRAEAALIAAATAAGLSAREASATVRSGLAGGAAHPRHRPNPADPVPAPGGTAMVKPSEPRRELPEQIQVRPWADPWREANGFPAHSAYVELVWSGRLGPTATLLYRRLGGLARACPEGASIDVADLGAGLGLGRGDGRWSPLARSVGRLVVFGAARWDGDTLEVRRALPPVTTASLARLGPTAQRIHAAEMARRSVPDPHGGGGPGVQRRAARSLG